MSRDLQSVRETLLAIALRLFTYEGYDAVGIQRIVDEAHVTKPTLYHYFGNKEGLMRSILSGYMGPFFDRLEQLSQYEGDLIRTVEEVTIHYMSYGSKDPETANLIHTLRSCPLHSEAYGLSQYYFEREEALMVQMFEAIANHHTNLKGKEGHLARSFIGLVDCQLAYELKQLDRGIALPDNDERFRRLAKQFMYGIFA